MIGHPGVRRVFALSGFDTVISIYPNLPAALSGTADTMAGGASRTIPDDRDSSSGLLPYAAHGGPF